MVIKLVKFKPIGEEAWQGGIYINYHLEDAYIICGCCGKIFEMDEIEEYELLEEWEDISEEILRIFQRNSMNTKTEEKES